jgi:hypothetical protein
MYTQEFIDTVVDKAAEIGTTHGRNDVSWWLGDFAIPRKRAQEILDDPSVLEIRSPLSGEYAGDYLPTDLAHDVGITPDHWAMDTVCFAYEDAYFSSLIEGIELDCMRELGIDPETGEPYHSDLDLSARYSHPRVGHGGDPLRIVGFTGEDTCLVVRVGDDREEIVTVTDLKILPEHGYCAGCGQVSCSCA